MPVVHISLIEGRDETKVKECVRAVARTIHESLGAPFETIRVFATTVPAMHWAVGETMADELLAKAKEQKNTK